MRATAFCATLSARMPQMRAPFDRMQTRHHRFAAIAAALLAVLVVAAPAAAVVPQPAKAIPTQTDPYVPGQPITVNTDILSASGMAGWAIDQYLAKHTHLPPLGAAFLKAERDYGVNAIVLVAIAMHESGWGNSDIARLKRNLFGYHAYDRDPFKWAETFSTYAEGVDVVAKYIRDDYLTPGGPYYRGYTTLRAVNLSYATGVTWADRVTRHANWLITEVPTLASRKLRFGSVSLPDSVLAATAAGVKVKWKAATGASIPEGIRFSAKWTPVSVVETASVMPRRPDDPDWRAISHTKVIPGSLTLDVAAPATPGLWRLDLDPRDSDGGPLPDSDHPTIASSLIRVFARTEAVLALSGGADGTLVASVRSASPSKIRAAAETPAQELEAWALPLDPATPAVRLASQKITDAIGASAVSLKVPLKKAPLPSIVVLRLNGSTASRTVPAVVLVRKTASGKLSVTSPWVSDPRSADLVGRDPSEPAPVDVVGTGLDGLLGVRISAAAIERIAEPAPQPTATPSASPAASPTASPSASPDAGAALSGSRVVVRSIAVTGPAAPSLDAPYIPKYASGQVQLTVEGVGPGVRLVVAWLLPEGGGPVAPYWLGWVDVSGASE